MKSLSTRCLTPNARKAVALVSSLATATQLAAGTLNTDFSIDPGGLPLGRAKIENGILKLQDLQELIDGTANLPLHGSYVFGELDPGLKVAGFTATFQASIHGGTEQPAQGFCLVLANDLAFDTPFREGGATGDGTGFTQGLVISFDTIDNLSGFGANGNDPGDAPGIIVRIGGQRVAAKKFAGLRTGSANNQTPVFVPVTVKLDPDGTLDVNYNGTQVYDDFPIPYVPLAGAFGFGAGTAELTAALRDNHWIDNLNLTTTTVTPGSPTVLAIRPLGTSVRPDAIVSVDVENLGNAAVTLSFDDGAPVVPNKSVEGAVTTLTYDPPGLMAPGSAHTVQLNYGDKTLRFAFTVINAAVLPASFAVAAASVDTATSGFAARVHQLEVAAPGGNTFQRCIDQLAGKLGDNVADLSLASNGEFQLEVINMDENGGQAGQVGGEGFIPGIPGLTGSTDNIAMEITGYLELKQGVVTFGAVSDDNIRISLGPDPRDAVALNPIDIGIGTATATVLIEADGIYPFRAVWGEGTGGANLELWASDASGAPILLNDRATTGHIKAYRSLKAGVQAPPYLSSARPAPGEANVSTAPRIVLALTEDATTVNASSIKLFLNGQEITLPEGAVVKDGKVTTITYPVRPPLEAKAEQELRLEFSDSAGRALVREYVFTTGAAGSGGFAGGQWDFDKGTLEASVGRDLRYIDDSLANRYQFGTTTQFGIPDIDGKPARVIHIPYTPTDEGNFKQIGLRVNHAIAPNGGGAKVNQYTIIMDLLWGEQGPSNFGSILQTHDLDNPTDGDMFWRNSDGSYGKGCCSNYDGISQEPGRNHRRGEWARVVFSVDLASTPRKFAKFVNGFKHREDVIGDGNALDSRFALPPEFFMFGDGDDNERTEAYVNSIQVREGALSDEEVAALGGPTSEGIPLPYAQWDFDRGDLSATAGHDLQYLDASLSSLYRYGSTTQLGIPDINGEPANVIHIPYTPTDDGNFKRIGLRANHGLGANGGGAKLNQYTLIMDVLWGEQGPSNFGGVLQTHDLDNPTDGDMFWRASDGSYGKGCCSNYDGISQEPGRSHRRGEWARIVFSVDLASSPRKFAKFVNGFKHREDVIGDGNALDSRFGLPVEFFLFGDGDDNERTEAYVNSIQIRPTALSDDEVAALGGASALGIPTPNAVKGEWNFDNGTLAASIGQDLLYIDPALANLYRFGSNTQLGVPGIDGRDVRILHVPYTATDEGNFKRIGLRMNHGIRPNGGGAKVNQWTLIMDLLWGETGPSNFGGVLQTHDLDNPTDGDMFWRASDGSYGKGCCSNYDGISQEPGRNHRRGEWARVVFAVDLASTPRRFAKYVNGHLHRSDVIGDGNALDSRFGLPPQVLLFGDGDDNERTEVFINAIQIRDGAASDEEVAALGGPSPYGIPGAPAGAGSPAVVVPDPTISITAANGVITITWADGELQSADEVDGTFAPVLGATSPLVITEATGARYYRSSR